MKKLKPGQEREGWDEMCRHLDHIEALLKRLIELQEAQMPRSVKVAGHYPYPKVWHASVPPGNETR